MYKVWMYTYATHVYACLLISCNVTSISIVKHNTLDELEKIETPLCEVSSRIANARPNRVFRVGSRTLHVAQPSVWEWLIRGTGKYELKRLTSKEGFAKISRDNGRQWQMQIRRLNPRLSRVLLSDLETRRATHMLTHFMDSYG